MCTYGVIANRDRVKKELNGIWRQLCRVLGKATGIIRELVRLYIYMCVFVYDCVMYDRKRRSTNAGRNKRMQQPIYVLYVRMNEMNRATHLPMQIFIHTRTQQCMTLTDGGGAHYPYGFVSTGYMTPMCACTILGLGAQRSDFIIARNLDPRVVAAESAWRQLNAYSRISFPMLHTLKRRTVDRTQDRCFDQE